MALFNFRRKEETAAAGQPLEAFLKGYSIEVMPRTAEKVDSFRDLLPKGTRVYIAHIDGTPIEDMVATAKRIGAEGFDVMPHFPARIIKDKATLTNCVAPFIVTSHTNAFRSNQRSTSENMNWSSASR